MIYMEAPKDKDIIIEVENLTKTFRVPSEKRWTMREKLLNFWKGNRQANICPINEISFQVRRGEFLGIVGRNGSGKSTLLRILAGVYRPDPGSILRVGGKISPMLELGVGFHSELTGRENVYLNATILGLTRKQIDDAYEEIVRFSELEHFMEMQVKHYSSGMQVRLAFAVAIQVDAPIMLLDEVLAVGDFVFQEKCFALFEKYKREGRTIILVTHDEQAMLRFADRILWLKEGRISGAGTPEEVLATYMHTESPQ